MLPSFGVAFEDDIHDDREALLANMRAFNRYIEDDWGYAYQNRIFALPLITLVDREWAIAELERVAALGARGFILRPGPGLRPLAGRSPFRSLLGAGRGSRPRRRGPHRRQRLHRTSSGGNGARIRTSPSRR